MADSWQTLAAGAVVALTTLLFLVRLLRGKRSGCGGRCDCPSKAKAPR